METNEPLRHPIEYKMFNPNVLLEAKKELSLVESRVYHFILNHDHKNFENKLIYDVPYDEVLTDLGNLARDKVRIESGLLSKVFKFDKAYANYLLDKNGEGSVKPFTSVLFMDDSKLIEVTIHAYFKKVLIDMSKGFTKGDYATIRKLNHVSSQNLYWVIRQKQAFRHIWEVDLSEFKRTLQIEGKYEDFRNLKSKFLDVAKEDLKSTWADFSYETSGRPINKLKFFFRFGKEQENDLPAGYDFDWEKALIKIGVNEATIKIFRQKVRSKAELITPNGTTGWDSSYIVFSIIAAKSEYEAKVKDPSRKKVNDTAAWFVTGLLEGYWLTQVNDERKKYSNTVQTSIF